MKSYHWLLLLPLMSMGKCEKDAAPVFSLPPATQSGANTLGFIVDGRVWRDYGIRCTLGGCDTNKVHSSYRPSFRSFDMYAYQTARNLDEHLQLQLDSLTSPGRHIPSGSVPGRIGLEFYFGNALTREAYTPRQRGDASITITRLDTVQRIIAGSFEGVLYGSLDPTKKVTIRDGRFDVKYRKE